MKTREIKGRALVCASLILLFFSVRRPAAAEAAGSTEAPSSALAIAAADLRLEARADGGYDLFIRAKTGLASVLLTESTKDPAHRADSFAYRAAAYNAVNGDEKRILNGSFLNSAYSRYSLVSSTPRPDAQFGRTFHILIPAVIIYGYPWSRSGSIAVGRGTFLNIRAFAKAYADYSGPYLDNPFTINIARKPLPPEPTLPAEPAPEPVPGAITEPEIQAVEAPPAADRGTSGKFDAIIGGGRGQSLDLVICLDTTESMVPYIEDIRRGLAPILQKRASEYSSCRIGLVLYKDYWPDDYISQKYPFTADIAEIMKPIKEARIEGGRDIPEALFEALYSAVADFDWKADKRDIIFLTDAAPHARPKGDILFSHVVAAAASRRIDIEAIIEPSEGFKPKKGIVHYPFEHARSRIERIAAGMAQKPSLLVLGDLSQTGPAQADSTAGPAAGGASAAAAASSSVHSAPGWEDEVFQSIRSGGFTASLSFGRLKPAALPAGRGNVPQPSAGAPQWFTLRDREALDVARRSRADFVLVISSIAPKVYGAAPRETSRISETVARLIEVKSGKELERDVIWQVGLPSGSMSEFVNGWRNK